MTVSSPIEDLRPRLAITVRAQQDGPLTMGSFGVM
jgi:hypothetical protein